MNNKASILNLESKIFDGVIDSSELYIYDENGNVTSYLKDLDGDNIADYIEITGNVNSFISFNGDRIAVLLNVNPNELTDKNFQEF